MDGPALPHLWPLQEASAGGAWVYDREYGIPLGFDGAQGMHVYGFKWTSSGITWYVDGTAVYSVVSSVAVPTPKAVDSLLKVGMHQYPVSSAAYQWAGTFVYPGSPLVANFDWVRYTDGEGCTIGVLRSCLC